MRILFRKTESFAPLSIYILTFSIVIKKSDKILIPDPFLWLFFLLGKILESALLPKMNFGGLVSFCSFFLFYGDKVFFFPMLIVHIGVGFLLLHVVSSSEFILLILLLGYYVEDLFNVFWFLAVIVTEDQINTKHAS